MSLILFNDIEVLCSTIIICRRENIMEAIEFKSKIKNGIIRIPEKYKQKTGNTVKVIVITEKKQIGLI
jgi:hypothetical protein